MSQGFTSNIALPVTGTGSYVKSTSPTITTPNIVGVTDASNASAGSVGEYTSSVITSGSAVSVTTATAKSITSISLTAGDWDVWGQLLITGTAGAVIQRLHGEITTTTNTATFEPSNSGAITATGQISLTVGTNTLPILSIAPARISVNSTTTVYLVALVTFTTQPASAFGKICARRVR